MAYLLAFAHLSDVTQIGSFLFVTSPKVAKASKGGIISTGRITDVLAKNFTNVDTT
jgi:hypothetical protein